MRKQWIGSAIGIVWLSAPAMAQPVAPVADGALENEIVVTAQRREERLTDVPLSITTLSGQGLADAGVTNTLNLSQVTPALNFAAQGVFSQPTIRGIGSTGQGIGDNPNVATYVDGVYQPAQYGGIFEFNNIERIEVLKGPQGTLFGRNATGGAIQIITKTPKTEFGGNLTVGYARFDERIAKLYVTGGSGTVAADIAALYVKDDGYIRDIARNDTVGSRENKTVRSKVRFEPSETVNFTVIGTYSDRSDNTVISGYNLNGNSATGVANPNVPLAIRPNTTSQSFLPVNDVRQRGVSLRGEFDLGAATLSSISAYEYVWNYVRLDTDGTSVNAARFDSTSTAKALMQELNLASNGDNRLDWVAGVFLYDDNAKSDPYFFNGLRFNFSTVETRAYAVFGEVNYQLTDQLSVIAGMRYSHEKKKLFAQGFPPFVSLPPQQDEKSWDDLAPRLSLRYALTPSSNIYATYSQGFKSGVFNSTVVGQPAVDPENVDAVEIGYKTSDLAGLALNIAGYYYDYSDIQVSAYVAGSNTVNLLQNAASAEIYGIDGDLSGRINEHLRIRLGGAWTHARYKDFRGAILLLPNPGGAGNRQISGDASGNRMIRQPEFTATAGLDYQTPLAGGDFKISGNVFVSGSYYWDPGNIIKEPSYTIVNTRASWTTPDERWTFTVYSDNLLGEDYGIYVASSGRGNRKVNGRPRTVGVQASVNF